MAADLGRPEAVALYVYPGDFERRGLTRNTAGTSYDALGDAETQYVVGGARLVWNSSAPSSPGVDRDHRLTIGLSDIIQSTNVTLDLITGELVETGNYYANGARESYRSGSSGERSAAEPMGFTGKEADEEVGLTYFGQRYLMSHLGRWASPDPLQTHAVGGGEALNGYHYVAGSVLQARDPQGLVGVVSGSTASREVSSTADDGTEATRTVSHTTTQADAETAFLRDVHAGLSAREARRFSITTDSEGRRVLTYTGSAASRDGLSETAQMWLSVIESDSVAVYAPSTVLSSRDEWVAPGLIMGLAFDVTVPGHSLAAGEHLQFGGAALAGAAVGEGHGAMGSSARGGSGEVLVTYVSAGRGGMSREVTEAYRAQAAAGAMLGRSSVEVNQGTISGTLGHETATHVLGFFRGEPTFDAWTPGALTAAIASGRTAGLLDRVRRESSIAPLERSATIEAEIASHVRLPRGASPSTGADFRRRQIEALRAAGLSE